MTYNPTLENIKSKISTTSSQKSKETREDDHAIPSMIIGISPLFLLLACYITAYCTSCTGWMLSQLWLEQYSLGILDLQRGRAGIVINPQKG